MKRFEGQTALVAGGARGIGEGIARRLLSEGAQVALLDVSRENLEKARNAFKEESWETPVFAADIKKEENVREAINDVVRQFSKLDILVNCAAIVGQTAVNTAEYKTEIFDEVLAVNLKGAFLLTKYALPTMLRQNYGRILHIASIGGKEGNPGMAGYAASKSGLMGLVKGAGKEYATRGITINGIAPAVIATPMNADTDPALLKYMADKIPMKRLGTIKEVAALACWIVSKEASFNTGFVFDLSGGRATY